MVLVLDTETTTDQYQNLLFGSCGIWITGNLHRFILFHGDSLGKSQTEVVRRFSGQSVQGVSLEVMTRSEFIESVFYPWAYDARALCVGFNLPFDLSRGASGYGLARKRFTNGFSLKLLDSKFHPRIRIKSLDSKRAFIEFGQVNNGTEYAGRFLDLHTLAFAMTNKNMSLETACDHFDAPIKKRTPQTHGRVTEDYVNCNIQDTLSTHSLFQRMLERYHELRASIRPEQAYSPASLGKSYLEQMGIKSFLEKNPTFPRQLLGRIMTTFYGGRAEIKIRKEPVKVRYMDFTCTYPALFVLMGLWPFLISERIEYEDATDDTRKLLAETSLESMNQTVIWEKLSVIVLVKPDADTLPVRTHFGNERNVWNIGLCELTSRTPLWYPLPDVAASKLLAGRSPRILKAVRFKAKGVQEGLSDIDIVGGIHVSKNENLIRKLVEARSLKKKEQDEHFSEPSLLGRLDREQEALKTIANSISYGIFIEVNTEEQAESVGVYGLDAFRSNASKKEIFGRYFHPIVAALLTSGARLMVAVAEAWLKEHRGYYAFCDTDSLAVSPNHWMKLQEFFELLNPFSTGDRLLKLEKENYDRRGNLIDPWFYGISAKRYVLFRYENGEPEPVKWSSHGLGHLIRNEENWEKKLWRNILRYALGRITKEDLLSDYSGQYAVSKLVVSTAHVMKRIATLNRGKKYCGRVKPFNFVCVGQPCVIGQERRLVHPMTSFADPRLAPYQPFVDYKTGRLYDKHTEAYWKTLDSVVGAYLGHPESKFRDGDRKGRLHRRSIRVKKICYIGKEANELEESEVLGVEKNSYTQYRMRKAPL